VPITVKAFNNSMIEFWIGPERVDGHIGIDPVCGTLSAISQAVMQEIHSSIRGEGGMTTQSYQNNVIQISAMEVDEVYRWSTTDGSINPSLELVANTNNTIEIQIPTHEKHELVIESNGSELASSGDINADS
jgi:hypothetical protein